MNKKIFFYLYFFLFFLGGLFFFPQNTLAEEKDDRLKFEPQISIPGSKFKRGTEISIDYSTTFIAEYLKAIYDYLLSVIGIVAAIALMIGGALWLTAGGSNERVSQAKSWITGSLTGLVLALTSYLILRTINPHLVQFTPTEVVKIEQITSGCCEYTPRGFNEGETVAEQITSVECYKIFTTKNPKKPEDALYVNNEKMLAPISTSSYQSLEEHLREERFSTKKRANYATGKCETFGYCEIMATSAQNRGREEFKDRNERTVVAQMSQSQCEGLNGARNNSSGTRGPLVTIFYDKETFEAEENNERFSLHKDNLRKHCEGRGNGSSCKNSKNVYCYCYYGMPYINWGVRNEPCGDDGGKCIPHKGLPDDVRTEEWKKMCQNKDINSRSCDDNTKEGNLICCEPKGIWGGYNPVENYSSYPKP